MWKEIAILAALLLVCQEFQRIQCAKILGIMNLASPSHHIFNRAISRALAARGHQVTVLSNDADKDVVPNLTYMKMEGVYDDLRDAFDYEDLAHRSTFEMVDIMVVDWTTYVCEKEFNSTAAKKLRDLSNVRFDLIIVEAGWGECLHGFIPWFGYPPVVAISAYGLTSWTPAAMGSPENPSYMPSSILPYTDQMTFPQRLFNAVLNNFLLYKYEYVLLPKLEAMAKEFFKQDMPSFMDIQRNFSIYLANTVPGLDYPRPLSPNIIPVGGMHIKEKPDPLPEDLQKFLDEAKDGFIFFSLGSNVRSDALTAAKRQALLDAFSELPQRILWKFESDNLPGQPPNVKIGKWLPQSDILAHPNIRMFITHCGKISTTEATYRGVPVIGMPFMIDQIFNIKNILDKGIGVELDFKTLTKESVLKAVKEVLNNPKYLQNMKKLSAVYRDKPNSALDRAVFWTEYVIRHNGAPHLRPSSTELYFYQYLLLDILLVILITGLITIYITYITVKKIFNLLNKKPRTKTKRS